MAQTQKFIFSLFRVVVLLLIAAPVYADHKEVYDEPNVGKGKQLYETTCIACHGAEGKSTIPGIPNFTIADNRLVQKEHLILLQHIRDGYQSPGSAMAMPPKGGNASLSDQDIADILEYMLVTFAPVD